MKSSINNLRVPKRILRWHSTLLKTQSVEEHRGRHLRSRSVCLQEENTTSLLLIEATVREHGKTNSNIAN